jgi:hypothetical protein
MSDRDFYTLVGCTLVAACLLLWTAIHLIDVYVLD